MMWTRLTLTMTLLTLVCSAATQLKQGDWGQLSFRINPGKCFTAEYSTRSKLYSLYTNVCHPDQSYQSQFMQWRYDSNTHQLQNRGLTANFNRPYCLAAERLSYKARIWAVPCKGNTHFRFLVHEVGAGIQFILEAEPRYCIEWYGSYIRSHRHNTYGYLYHCRDYARSEEQWSSFVRKEAYNGRALKPVQDPKVTDGVWGQFRFPYTGMCIAVDSAHYKYKLVQRVCHDNDESQRFRYVKSRSEIRNYLYPRTDGGGGCATKRSRDEWYITSCTGSHHQKFLVRDATMFRGTYQQIQLYDDTKYCWEMYRSDTSGYIKSRHCHSQDAHTMDPQYIQFIPWSPPLTCPAGKIPNSGGTACVACPATTYQPQEGGRVCLKCREGTTSGAGAARCHYINTCQAGTYMDTNTGVCHSCPLHTFTDTQGSTECSPCPSGTHTKHQGATHCVPDVTCPPGSFTNGAAGCTPCPLHTYSNTANSASCVACPKGHYTQSTGSTWCLKRTFCGPGKFHNGHLCQACPRNTFDNTVGNTECTPCPTVYETKSTGATRCTRKNSCQAGSFHSEYANTCQLCPRDTFTDKPHQVRCERCPSGTGTRAEGGTGCERINYCRPGKYHNGEGCVDCPVDTFTNTPGSWKCLQCPWGQMTGKKGATSCRKIWQADCTPGNYYTGVVCRDCPKDRFSPNKGMKYCKECAAGYETETTGANICTKKGEVVVLAKSAVPTVYCKTGTKQPACLVRCSFETNAGVKIVDKAKVSFYKLVGTTWKMVGPVYYNSKTNWFSMKVADSPSPTDSGVYKCSGQYGGVSGSIQTDVVVS